MHMTSVHSALDLRIFHKECCSLARAGYEVTIVGPSPTDMIKEKVRIKAVPQDQSRFSRMTRTVFRVYIQALKVNADIYHFHDPELIPVGLLLRAKGKHVIYDIHEDMPKDILSKHYLPVWTRPLISWMADTIERVTCGHFSALVAVTPSIAERFLRLNNQTVIVHNYPYLRELIADQDPLLPWESRRDSIAYVGGITGQRAIREMVYSMAMLPNSLPATLELAGNDLPDDVQPEDLQRHPGWARVHHHGLLDQPSTFRLLHNVRAGLVLFHPVPNHREAMPQKMFEYMGAGLPVIASDFPLWRRIIGDTGCGLLVNPLSPSSIAGAIEYILTHPAQAEAMGRRGRAEVQANYNWYTQAEKLVNLYDSLKSPLCAA